VLENENDLFYPKSS